MPLMEITIEKSMGNEFWTNVYHIEASDLADAQTFANQIVAAERAIHLSFVTFTAVRVSDATPGGTAFQTTPINLPGLIGGAGETLPLFNTIRVDFAVNGRRPGRKFLRLPIQEAQQQAGVNNQTIMDNVTNLYINPLIAMARLVNPFGQAMHAGSVHPRVAMRQLKRGSKRKISTGP